jgi:redox-sensitive bicupin YhaK (pirin superfamily)
MKSQVYRKSEQGLKDIGWLQSNFIFSFSDYCNPVRTSFGSLVVFNDDYVAPGKGFGIHPHANMEIISVLLQGKMNHIDNLGYSTTIESGGVQIMSAGSGLRHEEYNIGEEEVNFLQIWIQPKLQNITPRYQQRAFPKENYTNKLQTIVSSEEGSAHCWINQNAKLSLGFFDTAHELKYTLNPVNKCLFIFVIEGRLNVDGTDLERRDAIGVWETGEVPIHIAAGTHFLIIETPINQA